MENLNALMEDSDYINVNELIALHHEIKSPLMKRFKKAKVNEQTSKVWFESGIYLKNLSMFPSAEVCFFMSSIYNKLEPTYLQEFIYCLSKNEKFIQAIDHLSDLYKLSLDTDITIFWETITSILPLKYTTSQFVYDNQFALDVIIHDLKLNKMDPMTWICLGYTMKLHDHIVYSSQAFDNAIALKELNLQPK